MNKAEQFRLTDPVLPILPIWPALTLISLPNPTTASARGKA